MMGRLVSVLLMLVLFSLACNLPGSAGVTPSPSTDVITQVALTLAAMGTTTATTTPGQATPSATQTLPQTNTPTPTITQRAFTPTFTVQPCDQAQFISDVTIPDGTKMTPGQAFTKTWRLRNLGSCTWTSSYSLVFASGDSLGAPSVVNLTGNVASGATVDVSVDMKSPMTAGNYRSNWKLRNASGQVFGVQSDQPFFVDITVVAITPTITLTPTITITPPTSGEVYNFVTGICNAEWLSKAGEPALTCPGSSGDPKGYVMRLNNPTLETGAVESGSVLLTVPRNETNGVITGRYPPIAIQSGYHFKSTLACLNGMNACTVTYNDILIG
jgi:hypothetical protein